jgi:predicted Ser/Thr protein kinase
MEKVPFYAIKGSPVNESPLGLFNPAEDGPSSRRITAFRALPEPDHVAVGGEAAA